MTTPWIRKPHVLVAAGVVIMSPVLLAGCASSSGPSEPQETVRNQLQTAPADLQLLCANAAASSAGVESSSVLPVSSLQLDSTNYQVDLNAGGNTMRCIIGTDGVVKSVQAT